MSTAAMSAVSRRLRKALLLSTAIALIPGAALAADIFSVFRPNLPIADEEDFFSSGDFGGVGLLQTRTARFGPDGQFDFGGSSVDEYRRYYLNWHILPWLEATFRYTDIRNRLFSGVEEFSGDQTFKDRGADVKIKLLDESKYVPALAIGIQDGLGTGQFSGEYLVASKRWFDLDFSLGLGWGYFTGSSGGFDNPLTFLGDSFKERASRRQGGGTLNPGQWFSGERTTVFGGVEWRTPIEGITLKLEYDPNDYRAEPLNNVFEQNTHWNFGLVYRPFSWLDTSVGYERGTSLMVRAALRSNLQLAGIPKFLDDPPPALGERPTYPSPDADEADADDVAGAPEESGSIELADSAPSQPEDPVDALFDVLEDGGFSVETVELADDEAVISVGDGEIDRGDAIIERAAMSVLDLVPEGVEKVAFVAPGATGGDRRVLVRRADLERLQIVDHLFEGLRSQGYRVDAIDLTHSEAKLQVTRLGDQHSVVSDRRAARLVIESVPTPIQSVTLVRMSAGLEVNRVSLSRSELRSAAPVDDLFDTLEGSGFEVEWVEFSRRRATVYVSAMSTSTPGAMRLAAKHFADLSPEPVDEVTLVKLRAGAEESRLTVAALGGGILPDPRTSGQEGSLSVVGPISDAEAAAASERIFKALADAGFPSEALYLTDSQAMVFVTPTRYRDSGRNIGRPARIVANNAPASVEQITIVSVNRGMELSRVTLLRKDLERAVQAKGSPEEIWANAQITSGQTWRLPPGAIENADRYPDFSWSLTPRYRQSVGGPDGFILYQIYAALSASVQPMRGLHASGTLSRNIVDTFDQLELKSDSELPRVRSDIARYLRQGTSTIENLYINYAFSPYPEWYAKVTGGLLEKMYGGVAGEVLYRPFD
ncbi:MAG: YjbH domain-containing protein, partial [Minwuiales bacterium]|nr:YjbH domain-containing protein [Minwuiales bacterium]